MIAVIKHTNRTLKIFKLDWHSMCSDASYEHIKKSILPMFSMYKLITCCIFTLSLELALTLHSDNWGQIFASSYPLAEEPSAVLVALGSNLSRTSHRLKNPNVLWKITY